MASPSRAPPGPHCSTRIHRIIGQLYGGSAACAGNQNNGQFDYYGRMGVSFNNGITEHLDPLDLGLEVLDGYPSAGCVTSFALDLGLGIASAPEGVLCGGGDVTIEVNLSNFGTDPITSAVIGYAVDGGPQQTTNWSGNLAQYDNTDPRPSGHPGRDGTTEVDIYVISVNGADDENGFNDAVTVEFTAFEGDTYDFTFQLVLDDYGSETTWEIRRFGTVVYSGGPYEDGQDQEVISIPMCLEDGCYILEVEDGYGDGMCCDYGEGSFSVLDPQGDVVLTGGEFDDSTVEQFCTDEMSVGGARSAAFVEVMPNPATDRIVLVDLPSGATVTATDLLRRFGLRPDQMETGNVLATDGWPRGWVLIRAEFDGGVTTSRVLLR